MKGQFFVLLSLLFAGVSAQETALNPYFPWINQQKAPRPEYVWQGAEDIIYHNTDIANKKWATAPEFYAFLSKNWTFNRQMKWERTPENLIFCYSEGDTLKLTGTGAASEWFTDPANSLRKVGNRTIFEKKSVIRVRDAAVMPAFQFHPGQHPVLELVVNEADCEWQFVVSPKGRAGVPLISSGWHKGAGRYSVNIAQKLAEKGYTDNNYAELNFAIGVWVGDTLQTAKVDFYAGFKTEAAIINPLPVIRTAANASKGVALAFMVTDMHGKPVPASSVKAACLNGKKQLACSPKENRAAYSERFDKEGDYSLTIQVSAPFKLTKTQPVRITPNAYYSFDKVTNVVKRNGEIISPVTGSYQGAFYFADNGKPTEHIVQGQEQWNRNKPDSLRLHWWESLTGKELNERFSFLAANKWKVVHLNQHWNNWERLDAGGNIAPHGAEQLALYIKMAANNGIAHIQDLSHYPYYENQVWQQYLDAGYKYADWFMPGAQPFQRMFTRYIKDVATVFKDETDILAIGASGEGDKYIQLSRAMDMLKTYKNIDTKHLFVGEPIHIYGEVPQKETTGWTQDLLGSRTYALGTKIETELDMGIYFRLNRMIPNVCMLEGSFPPPPGYSRLYFEPENDKHISWVGTEFYRTNLRQSVYLGLLYRQAMIITWDEQFTEDERLVFDKIRQQINWQSPLKQPYTAILISDSLFKPDYLKQAAAYERYLTTAKPLDYCFITDTARFKGTVIDLEKKEAIEQLTFSDTPLFAVKGKYAITYTQTQDQKQILAYVYNISNHKKYSVEYSYIHRLPVEADVLLTTISAQGYKAQVFDLNTKQLIYEGDATPQLLHVKQSRSDYFIVLNKL